MDRLEQLVTEQYANNREDQKAFDAFWKDEEKNYHFPSHAVRAACQQCANNAWHTALQQERMFSK